MYNEEGCCVGCTEPAPCMTSADVCGGCSPQSQSPTCPPPAFWIPSSYLSSLFPCPPPPEPCGDAPCAYDCPSDPSESEMYRENPCENYYAYPPCNPGVCEPPSCCPPPPSIFVKPPCTPPDGCPSQSVYYKVSAYPQDCPGGGSCSKAIKIEPQICCAPTTEPCSDLKRDVFVLKIAKKGECEERTEDLQLELRTPKRHPMGPPPFRADEETQCTPDDFAAGGKEKEKGKGKGKGKKGKGKKGKGKGKGKKKKK